MRFVGKSNSGAMGECEVHKEQSYAENVAR